MLRLKKNLHYRGAESMSSLYDVIYPSNDAKLPLILFCHGFKGFKDWGHWQMIFQKIAESGFAVVKFNFSHSGIGLEDPLNFTDLEAFGENNYLKELEDIDHLIEQLRQEKDLKDIIDLNKIHLIGHSRGGSMAILKAAKDKRLKSVVSWAAVADLDERLPKGEELEEWKNKGVRYILNGRTGQQMPMNYQFVVSFLQNKKELDVERACKRMVKPQLIVHGENDPTVGLEHAYALQVWNTKAQLITIPNADHVFNGKHPFEEEELPFESKQLVEATISFLKKV